MCGLQTALSKVRLYLSHELAVASWNPSYGWAGQSDSLQSLCPSSFQGGGGQGQVRWGAMGKTSRGQLHAMRAGAKFSPGLNAQVPWRHSYCGLTTPGEAASDTSGTSGCAHDKNGVWGQMFVPRQPDTWG